MILESPLKWAGGKRWLASAILRLWCVSPNARSLVEPFVGGGTILYYLDPPSACVNDINHPLMNFHRALVKGKLDIPWFSDDSEELYYQRREEFNLAIQQRGSTYTDERLAALFYYLNRTCFNGLCRFNKKGEFNVPYGKYKKPKLIFDSTPYKGRDRWSMFSKDYKVFLDDIKPDHEDFLYVDPPYDGTFTQYSGNTFTWENQVELAHCLARYHGVPMVVSNSYTDRIIDLYKKQGFDVYVTLAPRRISANGNREPAKEVLAVRGIPYAERILEQFDIKKILS